MDYYHNHIPDFSRYQESFHWDHLDFNLYLDTGKKDQVIGFYYVVKGRELKETEKEWLLGGLGKLAKELEGRVYTEIPFFKSDRFPLPWVFYHKLVSTIQSKNHSWSEMKGRNPDHLICRCFGVYKEDIHELIGSGVEVTGLRDLGDHLQAGIGCGTCRDDLLKELKPLLSTPVVEEASQKLEQQLWEKLDPQALANEAHDILRRFMGSHPEYGKLKLGGTRPGSILVMVNKNLNATELESLKDSLGHDLSKGLGQGLGIVFIKS